MTIPGNMWEEVWEAAQPVPARLQRRLFDDTKEMEKALLFIENRTPKEFANLLLPVLSTYVVLRLCQEAEDCPVPGVREALDRLLKRVEVHSQVNSDPKNYMVSFVG